MDQKALVGKAKAYLNRLCVEIGERPVGSPGNLAATAFFAETAARFSFRVEQPGFACMDWRDGGATLNVGEEAFTVFASPYSLGAQAKGSLLAVNSVDGLTAADMRGKVLLLHGEVAREPLMPKKFPFYNPAHHQQIVAMLETGAPAAIVCATERNAEMAGGLYPFPLIEDGDFDIPSAFMTDSEGARLLAHVGQEAAFTSSAQRITARGENAVARKGDGEKRVVLCAHIDAKKGTPGAIDNGGGVAALLVLAEMLAGHEGAPLIEIVALNGEDYYAAPGQQLYLAQNVNKLAEISLMVNLDGVGYREGQTAYSLYGCPDGLAQLVRRTFGTHGGLIEGPAWYQGDHTMFNQQGIPALALTSEEVWTLTSTITHTERDRPELVDCARLVETAVALYDLLHEARAFSQGALTA